MQKDPQKSPSNPLWRHLWSLVIAVSKASSWYPAGLKKIVMEFQPDSCSCLCHTFPGFILAQRRWTIWLPSRHLIFRRSEDEHRPLSTNVHKNHAMTPWPWQILLWVLECHDFLRSSIRKNIKSLCASCIDVDLIVWGWVGRDARSWMQDGDV